MSPALADARPPSAELLDAVLDEFESRWQHGERVGAEAYLPRLAQGGDAVALIYHEFCLAESSGHAPDPTAFLRRFPEHRERLGRLLGLHGALADPEADAWGEPDWPEPGDRIGPYRVLRELGRGGLARVYLAEQTDLADRLLVVKVARRPSPEPHLLARARHPHIVEVLRHAESDGGDGDAALHLICMPFLGGATLAALRGRRPRHGRAWLAALDRVAAPEEAETARQGAARQVLARLSFPKAMAWLVARLAEALDTAHRRGVVHGDLKPSNVLIAADGRPLLLDFNLAVDWDDPDAAEAGGTLAYMAPERLARLAGAGDSAAGTTLIGPSARRRADLYGLGLLLREALTGAPTGDTAAARGQPRAAALALAAARTRPTWLRAALADRAIPSGLRPILARCLAPDPADRYGRAAELAEDLDRYVADRPTVFAPQPGRAARVGRWARRHRVLVAAVLLAGAAVAATTVGALAALEAARQQAAIAKLDDLWSGRVPGIFRFRPEGQWRVSGPGTPDDAAARFLAAYDVLGPRDWRLRDDVRALPEVWRDDLELWLLEQTWRFAAERSERRDAPEDWRRALDALERDPAWAALKPIRARRDALRRRLGLPSAPELSGPPAPRWVAHYLDGLAAEDGPARAALSFFRRAAAARPTSFWIRYRAAAQACRVGDFDDALRDLDACLERSPANPALLAARGACLVGLNRLDAALAAFDRALALDPDFDEALRSRAHLRVLLAQPRGIENDLERYALVARALGMLPAWHLRTRTQLLRQALDPPVIPSAPDAPAPMPAAGHDDPEALFLLGYHLHSAKRRDEALAAYDAALRLNPDHLHARHYRAKVLRELGRHDEARRELEQLVAHPWFEELLVDQPYAVRDLHRLVSIRLDEERTDEALALARRGLDLARGRGQLEAEAQYALARVLAVRGRSDPAALDSAAAHLRAAAAFGSDYLESGWFATDRRMDPVRPQLEARLGMR
jgi:serine/threonine protein kinase/Tfp pilus assembly protein PilF